MKELKIKHGTAEWLKYRKNGIGGSDASAIFGCNPYKTNVELWEEKTGRREPKVINPEAVKYGQQAEKPMLDLFKLDYKVYTVKSVKNTVYIHDNGFMFASLDGLLVEKKTARKGIYEGKTANIFAAMHKEKWKNGIPQNYYVQVLHYLAVTGFDFAVLKARLISSEDDGSRRITEKHYFFDAKEKLADIEYLIKKEIEFWNCVVKGIRPALILPEI